MINREEDKRLWCDLKTDLEKYHFLMSGRAWDTGIIASAIAEDVANAFLYRHENENRTN